uniref:Glycosyl transferase family 1 domain-containing protein n=1 Tax=Aegilops tauschii subsp. strangulata TaxID=200361 RepID=A0A453F2P4_AEGTS
MGSLDSAAGSGSYKRAAAPAPVPRAPAGGGGAARRPGVRSRLARFVLVDKVDFLQWIGTAAAFFLVTILVYTFLPGSVVVENPTMRLPSRRASGGWGRGGTEAVLPRGLGGLENGEGLVFSFEDGPCSSIWSTIGIPVEILPVDTKLLTSMDWLDYDGMLVNSIEARPVFSSLLQEPFKSVPVIWTVHETSLAHCIREYKSSGMTQILGGWQEVFSRANVIVFPNYILPVMYAAFDSGNYFVIPGSPAPAFQADRFIAKNYDKDVRISLSLGPRDFVIAMVGSQFSYDGLLMEEALVLQAVGPLLQQYPSENSTQTELKVRILTGNQTDKHRIALEAIALNVGFSRGAVEHVAVEDTDNLLAIANLVIYCSCLDEQSFPSVLVEAMILEKLVIAPDLGMITKYIDDGINGLLFPRKNIAMLSQVLLQVVSNGELSDLGKNIASVGKARAKDLMASEAIEGYAVLLENVIKFPSETLTPLTAGEIPLPLKQEWKWHLFEDVKHLYNVNESLADCKMLKKMDWHRNRKNDPHSITPKIDETFSAIAWKEERANRIMSAKMKLEEEYLKERSDQPRGTWEEVYRNVKRVDRMKNELHERDEKELERTGQPLCIYEPFYGEGTWPFLHQSSLYRGIGLSSKGRRFGADDIDASSRLPLLNSGYYRDILGEFGAFFALANRIDRIHKNSWIGFQSWRVTARKANLSKNAESAMLEAIQTQKHGDAFYFWVRMDQDPRNHANQDFWSLCDAINAGNCRLAVLEAFQRMYGLQLDGDLNSLPRMPNDGDTWSVMQSWVMPTRSFLEFVMFSRMFVDALDAQMYDKHHQTGHCILSLHRDKHCYSGVLELIVNVWAFHSARRMVYVNPETGAMQEQHPLEGRRGQMSIQWFSYATLKSMDEDLAEEADADHPDRRWLWPQTGEVVWQGLYERERTMRQQEKERRKQQTKDKIQRMKKRARQKTIGRYIKPPSDDAGRLNDTRTDS